MIDADRIAHELDELAQFSDSPPPAVTRVMLSDADMRARAYLANRFNEAGLCVRTDAAGNMYARWEGSDPAEPPVATGSHTDAIPHSGKFDGTVGVLGGLEAIRSLRGSGLRPRRSIELIMFTSEEPTRYGVGCLGSRLLAGVLTPDEADALPDSDGVTFADRRRDAGLTGSLADVRLPAGHYHAFLELHIEQGPLLEQDGLPIGIVTDIAAPAALRVTYNGHGGHAGAVLMRGRRDALLPAAELALLVDRAARGTQSADTVATTGLLQVHPCAVNSIPSRTYMEIDVRDIDLERRDAVLQAIRDGAHAIAENRGVEVHTELINADPPAGCDPRLVETIAQVCQQTGHAFRKMVSRAYHDSLFMALVCPVAMIFIPCRHGISHRPDEYASPGAIAAGAEVLAGSLARLAE